MPVFEPKYTEEDFEKVLKNCCLCTVGYITKKVGCSRKTTETYLNKMLKDERVTKLEVDEGQSHVWTLND